MHHPGPQARRCSEELCNAKIVSSECSRDTKATLGHEWICHAKVALCCGNDRGLSAHYLPAAVEDSSLTAFSQQLKADSISGRNETVIMSSLYLVMRNLA